MMIQICKNSEYCNLLILASVSLLLFSCGSTPPAPHDYRQPIVLNIPPYLIEDAKTALDSIDLVYDRYFSQTNHPITIDSIFSHFHFDSSGQNHRSIWLSPITLKYWQFDITTNSEHRVTVYCALYRTTLTEGAITSILRGSEPNSFFVNNLYSVQAIPVQGTQERYFFNCLSDFRVIYHSIGKYQIQYREDPLSPECLFQLGLLDSSSVHTNEWVFHFAGANPFQQIQAISTDNCSFGAGKLVWWDCTAKEFYGYGM